MVKLGNEPKDFMIRAKSAQAELREISIEAKVNHLLELKEVILDSRDWIIDEIQKENGKTRSDALISEIFGVLDYLNYLIKFAPRILKDEKVHTPIALLGKKSRIYYEPLGTILIISPWNYPFYQAIVPITSAFIAGNSVLYKPSEHTPLTGVIEKILERAGFKPNWCQIVYGDGKIGSELIDLRPDKIFFTGSVNTGKKIMAQASSELIPVELELGGKDPSIVFEDASLERSVRGVLWGALTCSGQSCTSAEQVFIHHSIFENFKNMILTEAKKVRVGIDTDGDGEIGLMTTSSQVDIVADHIKDALNKGATLLSGNEWDYKSKSIPPLILENITAEMKIYDEETFGPIIPLISFESEQEVIDKCNASKFGLSASIWSKDMIRCERVARALHTGNVSINNIMLTEGNPALPFGGVKNSGIGRYKGEHGLRGFCHQKSVLIDSDSNKVEVNWYPYTLKKYKLFDKMTEFLFRGGVKNFLRFVITGLQIESYSDKEAKRKAE
ncbi:MAG: aldehyde dehydrogenase [Halobacteriovorax sp.]|nr:aldehyde dehydrogenase [Halobacteriovorax sp.]